MENTLDAIKKTVIVYRAIMRAALPKAKDFGGGMKERAMMERYVSFLQNKYKTVTEERIVDYCISMAHYRRNTDPLFVTTVFCTPSLVRYVEFDYQKKYFEDKWMEAHGLTRNGLIALIKNTSKHSLSRYIYMRAEDTTKRRSVERWLGPMFCERSTTMYSPFSPVCRDECKFASTCMIRTQQLYPELLRIRLEEWQKTKFAN